MHYTGLIGFLNIDLFKIKIFKKKYKNEGGGGIFPTWALYGINRFSLTIGMD